MTDVLYERIKSLRKQRGLTQAQLAERVGYSGKSMISYIEQGKVDLTESKIVEFANALQTTPSYLMGWIDDPDRPYPGISVSKEYDRKQIVISKSAGLNKQQFKRLVRYLDLLLEEQKEEEDTDDGNSQGQ